MHVLEGAEQRLHVARMMVEPAVAEAGQRDVAAAGLERRLMRLYPDEGKRDAKRAEYVARVRQDAFDGQQGFPLTLCAEQIGAMARAEDLDVASREADNLHDIVRVVCTQSNQVVNPAVADPFYNRHMPRAMRVEVSTNHCDYLQRPELWVKALSPLLAVA